MNPAPSPSHLQPSTRTTPPSTVSRPKIIFTVLGETRADGKPTNSHAAEVVRLFRQHLPEHLQEGVKCYVISKEAALMLDLKWDDALALFDDTRHRGLYSVRYAQRFPRHSVAQKLWIERSRWAVAIHRDSPALIAKQLAALFGKKFEQYTAEGGLLARTSLKKKKRKPRKYQRRERTRYAFA